MLFIAVAVGAAVGAFTSRAIGDQVLKERVTPDDLKPGDHIYTWRTPLYAHHGIFVGEFEGMHNAVIHFSSGRVPRRKVLSVGSVSSVSSISSSGPNSHSHARCSASPIEGHGVIVSCLDCFLSGGALDLFEYGVTSTELAARRNGTCTRAVADPDEDVVRRAKDLLRSGFGEYNVARNNCVDFAMYCKTLENSGLIGIQ